MRTVLTVSAAEVSAAETAAITRTTAATRTEREEEGNSDSGNLRILGGSAQYSSDRFGDRAGLSYLKDKASEY